MTEAKYRGTYEYMYLYMSEGYARVRVYIGYVSMKYNFCLI